MHILEICGLVSVFSMMLFHTNIVPIVFLGMALIGVISGCYVPLEQEFFQKRYPSNIRTTMTSIMNFLETSIILLAAALSGLAIQFLGFGRMFGYGVIISIALILLATSVLKFKAVSK